MASTSRREFSRDELLELVGAVGIAGMPDSLAEAARAAVADLKRRES